MYEHEISRDIEAFIDYKGITESAFAQQLGIQRSTLHNWKTGKSHPTESSLELIYGHIYRSGFTPFSIGLAWATRKKSSPSTKIPTAS